VFDQYTDLRGVFREIRDLCGRAITQELMCVLGEVLEKKLGQMEELQSCELDEVVPRMERFWGDDSDERIIRGSWNVYCEVDYNQVKLLAAADMETLGSSLYFSKRLKYLVLAAVSSELIGEVNLVDKFTTLLAFLTEGLLLSMQGISQREEDLLAFTSDLHYATGVDG
jgi:hypothetical protein